MLALTCTPGPPLKVHTVTSCTLIVLRDGLTNCIVEFALSLHCRPAACSRSGAAQRRAWSRRDNVCMFIESRFILVASPVCPQEVLQAGSH